MFRLKTLGGVSLERDGRPIAGRATQRRRLALLVYLAAAKGKPVSRDKLLALLWPERDQERGRHSLSQMLWALRQELTDEAVLAGIDEVRLNPEIVASDVGELEEAVARRDWEAVAAVYAGPFLDGFFIAEAPEFERWVAEKRLGVTAAVAGALESLATRAAAREEHGSAAAWWRRRVALDPLDSRPTLRLMESLAASGDRAGAIRHARVHAELLRQEPNEPPDPEVEALVTSLKRQTTGGVPLGSAAVSIEPPVPESRAAGALRSARQTSRRRTGLVIAGISTGAAIAAALTVSALRPAALSRTVKAAVLGSFEGADSALGLAVREAFRAELAQDESVRLLPDFAVAHALELMRLPSESRLTAQVTAEVAARLGANLAITGTVSVLGPGLQLVVQVVDPSSHATVLVVGARPERREEVIGEVGRMTRSLRSRLGALRPDTSTHPLPAVTTSSLEALEQYVLARRALSGGDRGTAITLGEGALAHDSLFPLAHYLVGDLLWFADQQSHSEAHLSRALVLAGMAPIREQLLVRARYQQLVADRPDSALSYFLQLRAAYPGEILAYEGMAWTLRALGEHRAAAAAADTAIRLDGALVPNLNNQLYALISVGDTAAALAVTRAHAETSPGPYREARYLTALVRRDWTGALAVLDREYIDTAGGVVRRLWPYRYHAPLLALGRLDEGRDLMQELLRDNPRHQTAPRALMLQAIAEQQAGNGQFAAGLARRAKAWVDHADISAAALARLYERLAILGAWLGDEALIQSVRSTVVRRDAGRALRSFILALETVGGAVALVRGRPDEAAGRLAAARRETFHGRSISSLMLLEADALARSGQAPRAAAIYRDVSGSRIPDPDFEIWPVLGMLATRRLAALNRPPGETAR